MEKERASSLQLFSGIRQSPGPGQVRVPLESPVLTSWKLNSPVSCCIFLSS